MSKEIYVPLPNEPLPEYPPNRKKQTEKPRVKESPMGKYQRQSEDDDDGRSVDTKI